MVGARRASPYGLEVARSTGARTSRGPASRVISGMALGVDSAAHAGALSAPAGTVAVLCAAAQRPYPAAKRGSAPQDPSQRRGRLRAPAARAGVAMDVPGAQPHRGGARGHGGGRRGGRALGRAAHRPVGARAATAGRSGSGPGDQRRRPRDRTRCWPTGAYVVRGAQDVLDVLYGAGHATAGSGARARNSRRSCGCCWARSPTATTRTAALAQAGVPADQGLAALAALELAGYVRREAGGRFSVTS